ncbi:MAG: branched-chain amino acid ABC transporter ATP-binding protein [Candidatus Rokuibacteriota bacterium]|nr:MAG: branched-chain amino acid ABC transporter ATP-binding protein [Candidatus Rokubacteria bacterium]
MSESSAGSSPVLLKVDHIAVAYGDLVAVSDVSLEVRRGELIALIGSNGAGKTTTLRAISGLLPLGAGRIELGGEAIHGLPPSKIVARGIAHVPEGRQLFPTLTVLENLELGATVSGHTRGNAETLDWVFRLFPRLRERHRQLAGTLSGGEQQMCAIGRALMARPTLLMLDEPSLGLAPVVVRSIFENLVEINRAGTTVLLVEQNVLRALGLCHRAYVIENGRIALEGPRDALAQNPHVKQAYLGM